MKRTSNILLLGGIAALVCCAVVWSSAVLFDWYEGRESDHPSHATNSGPSRAVPLRSGILHPHEVIGRLEIPRLGVSTVFVEGDDSAALRFGAGHVPWTHLPAENGNVGIAAHRDTVFRQMRNIALRDRINERRPLRV